MMTKGCSSRGRFCMKMCHKGTDLCVDMCLSKCTETRMDTCQCRFIE